MSNILLALFLTSIIICTLLTRYFIAFFTAKNIVDKPGQRRAHTTITPRGGGVAIVLTFAICFVILHLLQNYSMEQAAYILTSLLLVAGISLLDDINYVPAIYRLIVHLIASAIVVYFLLWPRSLFNHELPSYIDLITTVLGLGCFLNIYNFMDGIDGITSSESIHLSIVILLLCYLRYEVITHADLIVCIATLILGCTIGFIRYNWHPAKVFLGDVGSITLGFLLGLCLMLIASSGLRLFAACVIASSYYIADGGLTILIRLAKGEKIWLPHLNHFFQKAVRKGMSHNEITLKIAACNICLMLLSISALYFPVVSIILAGLLVVVVLGHFSR